MKTLESILREYFGLKGEYAICGDEGARRGWWTDGTDKAYGRFISLVCDMEEVGLLEKGQADLIAERAMDIV